jgi:predicted 3-demethylubiquinone-9 3-methyltransferase (glyoxalase superfamily)
VRGNDGGYSSACGRTRWQIVAPVLNEMLQDQDAKKTERVMQALLHRKKIDINTLTKAYEQ